MELHYFHYSDEDSMKFVGVLHWGSRLDMVLTNSCSFGSWHRQKAGKAALDANATQKLGESLLVRCPACAAH